MSDIEIIREALHFCSDVHGERTAQAVDATGALDRLAADRDEAWRAHELAMKAGLARGARAEKAERALAEMHAYFCGCTAAVCHALRPSEDSA